MISRKPSTLLLFVIFLLAALLLTACTATEAESSLPAEPDEAPEEVSSPFTVVQAANGRRDSVAAWNAPTHQTYLNLSRTGLLMLLE